VSNIGTVHYGGGCSGLAGGISNGTIQQSRVGGSRLRNAIGVFQDYRFGLVMENKKSDGYITEKIVNAYLSGGTVPIWYEQGKSLTFSTNAPSFIMTLRSPNQIWIGSPNHSRWIVVAFKQSGIQANPLLL
jgi:hypothetical protein